MTDSSVCQLPRSPKFVSKLLDRLIEVLNLKNDAALSRLLEVAPPIISKVRHRVLPVGPALLIRMHEVSDLTIRDLKDLMGDRRQKQRISSKSFLPDGSTAELVDGSTTE